ncbi:MAG TPA: BrxA/BrxB family bacilliredoxin [Candidatus Kryptonia bacterium]
MTGTIDLFITQMRRDMVSLGVKELRTAAEVDDTLSNSKGTLLVFVNSTCGCAGGIARPGLAMALKNSTVPDNIATVFAGQDKEATERARKYFTNQPPSSPSFALFRDGRFVAMIHRSDIEGTYPAFAAELLTGLFQTYCSKSS